MGLSRILGCKPRSLKLGATKLGATPVSQRGAADGYRERIARADLPSAQSRSGVPPRIPIASAMVLAVWRRDFAADVPERAAAARLLVVDFAGALPGSGRVRRACSSLTSPQLRPQAGGRGALARSPAPRVLRKGPQTGCLALEGAVGETRPQALSVLSLEVTS